MKEEVLMKYVRDLEGLLLEIKKADDNFGDLFESENMVIFGFGMIYKQIKLYGILIKDEHKRDLDAVAYLDPKAEKQITIEFELNSKSFIDHDPQKCDLLICWKHNWKECPDNIDVIELKYLWEKARK